MSIERYNEEVPVTQILTKEFCKFTCDICSSKIKTEDRSTISFKIFLPEGWLEISDSQHKEKHICDSCAKERLNGLVG